MMIRCSYVLSNTQAIFETQIMKKLKTLGLSRKKASLINKPVIDCKI